MATSTPADVALAVVLLRLAEAWPDAAEALTIVATAAPVSRAWCAAASDARVWCALVQRLWPYAAVAEAGEPIGGWRAHAHRRTLAARRVAAVRYTCNVDISDHTLCVDMHDAETGALVTSTELTVHEDVLLEHVAEDAYRKVLLCSERLPPPLGSSWPQSARIRVLVLRARDGAVAQIFADTAQRTAAHEADSSDDEDDYGDVSDDDDDDGSADADEDGEEDDGSADIEDELVPAQAAAPPLQFACYQIRFGFAADDGMSASVKLTVTARGRCAGCVELHVLAFHSFIFHMNGLTKQGFKHFLNGLTWVTPSARMTPRRVAVPPTAQHAGGALCSATLAALATPDVLRAIISYLAWNERAAMALTCSAFAAAVHSPDVAWRNVLLHHTAPALASTADDIMSGLFGWRDLAASIAEARLRLQQQKELLKRGDARFQRRWDRREACAECGDRAKLWRMESCALCEAANESDLAVDEPGPLSGFTFFVEVYAPTDAATLQEERLVFNGILPRVSASGVIGTGLHEATLYNSLSDDSGLFRAPELPDSALGEIHPYPRRTVCDPARDAADEWVKRVHMKFWVQRRSDGAVAHLGVGAHTASADSFLSPETTLEFDVYDLFYPLQQPYVSWKAATSGDRRRTISDPCCIVARVKLTWRLATTGEPCTCAQLFPTALLSFDAYRGDAETYTLLEEQMAAMLTALDWAL